MSVQHKATGAGAPTCLNRGKTATKGASLLSQVKMIQMIMFSKPTKVTHEKDRNNNKRNLGKLKIAMYQ